MIGRNDVYMKANEEDKKTFIEKLSEMSDEEIQTYIKENGKNNANSRLFVFHWENLDPRRKHKNI